MHDLSRACAHSTYGTGIATRWTRDMNGKLLFFVRWLNTRTHGVAGGWYRAKSLNW